MGVDRIMKKIENPRKDSVRRIKNRVKESKQRYKDKIGVARGKAVGQKDKIDKNELIDLVDELESRVEALEEFIGL